ncbi:MAG: hypothetical protein AAGF60_14695 [Pseudomonadota bacterium]
MAGVYGGDWVKLFSERIGLTKPRKQLALEEVPQSLKDGLWDVISSTFFFSTSTFDIVGRWDGNDPHFEDLTYFIWFNFLREATENREREGERIKRQLRQRFQQGDFKFVYDFVEFLGRLDERDIGRRYTVPTFREICNHIFEREMSSLRFVGSLLVPISNEHELSTVDVVMENSEFQEVAAHIRRAAELLGARPTPDYRNSIKESISAVESAVRASLVERQAG